MPSVRAWEACERDKAELLAWYKSFHAPVHSLIQGTPTSSIEVGMGSLSLYLPYAPSSPHPIHLSQLASDVFVQ